MDGLAAVSGIRVGRGRFFLFVSAGEMGGPEGERRKSVLYRGCTGLLYEILIPGDIQQAYIRLVCKSLPYLISRGCDAPGDDGSFYAAATFLLSSVLFPVVKFDRPRTVALSKRIGLSPRNVRSESRARREFRVF